ncbi:uncharacterized protein TNCV_303271 [Trichonephila clavipes]|nr:uncharacterized protein TNCV_303271 [Trichonephila clavipes]
MKRKENFQWLPKELHQLKYEAISVPQGSVRLVKKTQERKSSTCYLLITKGVTSSSPVPLKARRERERCPSLPCAQKVTYLKQKCETAGVVAEMYVAVAVVRFFLTWYTYEIQVEEHRHTIQTEEYRHLYYR